MEMVISNSIQPVNLFYAHNLVTDKIAYVFVNTSCMTRPYTDAEQKGKHAEALFRETLEFQEVKVFTNLCKADVIEKMNYLRKRSELF